MWTLWLAQLRRGEQVEDNWLRLTQLIAKRPRRRLYVRVLLAMAKVSRDPEHSGRFAEQAADILLTFLRKPRCAQVVYAHAAKKIRDPQAVLQAIAEISISLHRPKLVDKISPLLDDLVRRGMRETNEDEKQRLRVMAADAMIEGRPEFEVFERRVKVLVPWLVDDENLREEMLSALRDRQRYDYIVYMLKECAQRVDATSRRSVLLKLGHALRFGRGDLLAAVGCFEELIKADESDREAWGELLECLDDFGDLDRLEVALQKRIGLTSGLERRELVRQRALVLKKLGRHDSVIPSPSDVAEDMNA